MCVGNFHLSCLHGSCDCNHQSPETESISSLGENNDSNDNSQNVGIETPDSSDTSRGFRISSRHSLRESDLREGRNSGTGTRGRESNLKDQQSTGRKRAAKLYPLNREQDCDWKGRANCGGGSSPILGCITGRQQARHHGPDKTVSNNNEGNVHRICHYCHNRWHAANDPSYDWNNPCVTPHSPIAMEFGSDEYVSAMLDEMRYLGENLGKLVKVND